MGRTPGWIRDYVEWGIQFIKRARLQILQESRDFPLQLMGTGEMPSNLGEIVFCFCVKLGQWSKLGGPKWSVGVSTVMFMSFVARVC